MGNPEFRSAAHILFIVENNTVPSDIRVWREAKTAKQAGYEVSVIAPKSQRYSKRTEVLDGINIYRHPAFNEKSGKLNRILEYANALFWETILSVGLFLKRPFHLIHGANPPDHLFILAGFFRIFGVKYIFDHHDLSPELFLCKFNATRNLIFHLLRWMEKLSCLSADIVISTNESYKQHIVDKHLVSPAKIYVVRNDPEVPGQCETRGQPPIEDDTVSRLLYVGTIGAQDGVDVVVRVVHSLVNQYFHRNLQCLIVGDGDCLPQVKQLCANLGMDPYVDFTGYVYDRDKLKAYMEDAHVCLETAPNSEVNRKSTFIKVMEYMASGKPIVAFDLDETRFTVKDAALLVEPGDIQGYARAIDRLIRQPLARKELGEKGKKRIIEDLNWQRASRELLRAYEALAASAR
jgi:glycosyltransferase involved in cell wall biosynthesis